MDEVNIKSGAWGDGSGRTWGGTGDTLQRRFAAGLLLGLALGLCIGLMF